MTTLVQLRRIATMRDVILAAIQDGSAENYYHDRYISCTIGFGIKSQKFVKFPFYASDSGVFVRNVLPGYESGYMDAAIKKFFGNNYYDLVACGHSSIARHRRGIKQAHQALVLIEGIIEAHPLKNKVDPATPSKPAKPAKPEPVAMDDTKAKIHARISSLVSSIDYADRLLCEDAGTALVNIEALGKARDELEVLNKFI